MFKSRNFKGGAVGYISYDLVKYFENISLPENKLSFPDIMLYLTDLIVVFDHLLNQMKIISTIKIGKSLTAEEAYSLSVRRIEELQERINNFSNPFNIYRGLRTINPSSYMYHFNFGDFKIIGSSPEPLIKIDGRRVLTCPIAGTRKRGKDQKEDKYLVRDLLNDEKEKAEHNMLVDLSRNDLGSCPF